VITRFIEIAILCCVLRPLADLELHVCQGYGYEDDEAIHAVYTQYRESKIPLDGLHVDVDFQVG
jgi:hypothetical protein